MNLAPIFLPLISFFFCLIFSKVLPQRTIAIISSLIICISALFSFFLLKQIFITNDVYNVNLFKWIASGNLLTYWTLSIDFLSAIMIFIVNFVSALIQIYSIDYMKNDKSVAKFFCYMSLFTFFMLFLVSSGNLIQLYFGWEGVGFCSYLLIGFWYQKISTRNAAIKAFIVNRVGDFFFLLGIILIYITFGSISFDYIFSNIQNVKDLKFIFLGFEISIITSICILLLLGAMGKSAQLGLHTWLPDAMEGPTPVSALIHAATMVTAGVFLICKMSIFFNYSIFALNLVILIGALTAFFAATVAITQNDIKKIIAYSTCSQLGLMFIAAGISLYSVSIFHLTTHAFFKALLFLCAGSVIHSLNGEQNIKKMGGLFRKIPITYFLMVLGSLALCGIPYFSGYYSKEIIINSTLISNLFLSKFIYIISILVALLTSIYSFRLIYFVFHGNVNFSIKKFPFIKEPSFFMLIPMIILCSFAVFSGYFINIFFIENQFSHLWINSNVSNNLNLLSEHSISHLYSYFPTILAISGVVIVFYIYFYNLNFLNYLISKFSRTFNFLKNKWYFDDLYNHYFVKNIFKLGNIFWKFIDIEIIDKLGPNGIAYSTKKISKFFSSLQTGFIYHYAFSLIIGVCLLISLIIFFIFA